MNRENRFRCEISSTAVRQDETSADHTRGSVSLETLLKERSSSPLRTIRAHAELGMSPIMPSSGSCRVT